MKNAEPKQGATLFTVVSDTEVKMVRSFNAPRELVFKAYTDPDMIPQWWGPKYLTTKIDALELKPGGKWRFLQYDEKGNEYAFSGIYKEVIRPERLVYTFEFEPMPGHIVLSTVLFEEEETGRTKITATSVFQSKDDLDGMMKSGMESGAVESWDRLEELLAAKN
jgi:uncharacterized protein YndB with AHSA1/START domain